MKLRHKSMVHGTTTKHRSIELFSTIPCRYSYA